MQNNTNKHPLLGVIKMPWENRISLLCTASYNKQGSKYHCNEMNSYYAVDFDRIWEGNIEPETKILSITDGEIIFAGNDPENLLGLHVKIKHANNIVSLYAHLRCINKKIYPNKPIIQGEYLGLLGETGKAFGPHLHFQLFYNSKCTKANIEAIPEPISNYRNLKPNTWYTSNNKERSEIK